MSESLSFHPVLDEKLFNKIGFFSQPYTASYTDENEEIVEMEVSPLDGQEKVHQINDPKVHWDPGVHELNLNQKAEIVNPQFLFGDNGLVSNDAELGIAVRWYSKDSSQRKVIPVSYFTKEDGFLDFEINLSIEKGILRGNVVFETILYVIKDNWIKSYTQGIILGVLDSIEIQFDGDSSMFPIVEANDKTKPLWWVECNFVEPLHETFDEDNVSIVINIGHKSSKKLKIEKGLSSSPLLLEIIASSMQIIIQKVKDTGDWEEITRNENTEPGSIGEAIFYFINTFNWDVSSPEKLASSIREDLETRFK